MKKIFLLVFVLISINVFGQFPINATTGTNTSGVLTRGRASIDSLLQLNTTCFADTTAANRGRIDEIGGAMIRTCDDVIWLRNRTATKWLQSGGSSVDSISITNIYNNSIVSYVLINGDSCVVPTTGSGLAIDTICFDFKVCSVNFLSDSTFLACSCLDAAACDTGYFTPTPLYIFNNGLTQIIPGVVQWGGVGLQGLIKPTVIDMNGYDVTFNSSATGNVNIYENTSSRAASLHIQQLTGEEVYLRSSGEIKPGNNNIFITAYGGIVNLNSGLYDGITINPNNDSSVNFTVNSWHKDSLFKVDSRNDIIRMAVDGGSGTKDSALWRDPVTHEVTMRKVGGGISTVNNGLVLNSSSVVGLDSNGINPLTRNAAIDANYNNFSVTKIGTGHLRAGTSGNYSYHLFDSTYNETGVVVGSDFATIGVNEAPYFRLIANKAGDETSIQGFDDSLLFSQNNGRYRFSSVASGASTDSVVVIRANGYIYKRNASSFGTGTVTDFVFTDANGFDGTVSTSTTTPTLSLNTTVADTRLFYSSSGAPTGDANITRTGSGTINVTTSVTSAAFLTSAVALGGASAQFRASTTHGILLRNSPTDIAFYTGNANPPWAMNGSNLLGAAANLITWNATANGAYGGGADVGIGRNAAGVMEVNNGTLGTLRDTRVRNELVGTAGSVGGTIVISGGTSGSITIQPQAAAGTYNLNLPITAGTAGYLLTSQGGGATAMTWTDPATIAGVNIYNSDGTLTGARTVTMSTNNITWNSSQTTGGTTSSSFVINANSQTTGTALYVASSSLSSGSLIDVSVASTAAASNTQKGINVSLSEANATNSQTTYGIFAANSHSGTGNTNYGVFGQTSNEFTGAGVGGSGVDAVGVSGSSTNNHGVLGSSTNSGDGGNFTSGSGTGVTGKSTSGVGGVFQINPSSTNSVVTVLKVRRLSSGSATTGLGGSIFFEGEVSSGATGNMGSIAYSYTAATASAETSTITLGNYLAGSAVDALVLAGNGSVKLRPITATAASAITPAEGMIVMVSDTDATFTSIGFWGYYNAAWHAL